MSGPGPVVRARLTGQDEAFTVVDPCLKAPKRDTGHGDVCAAATSGGGSRVPRRRSPGGLVHVFWPGDAGMNLSQPKWPHSLPRLSLERLMTRVK